MVVKPGYKQTEAGVIPEDWSTRPLGAVVTFLDGKRRPVKDVDRARMRGSIPYYGASGIVDYVNDYLFDDNLILLGEDGENILSRSCRLAFQISGQTWVNNHAHVLKPNPNTSIGFLTDFLESLNYERFNSGTAQPKLNKQTCFNIPVAIPPTKAEQDAIAGALSDADALIKSLERLVVKKRNLKQGAIQELLTGKKRLPGFEGDWTRKQIGPDIDLLAGFPFPSQSYSDHGIRLLRGSNIKRGVTDWSEAITKSWPRITPDIKQYQLKACDIVVAMDGSLVGRSFAQLSESDLPALLLQRVARIRSTTIDMAYLKEHVCSDYFTEHCDAVKTVTAIPHISPKDIREFTIPIPPAKEEQKTIAGILSDMGQAITELEAQLAKAHLIKQGMMQQLLTGRIRLV